MQVLFTSDFSFSKNSKKLTQNAYFVVGFQKFLDHTLLLPKCDAPIFGQMEGLMEIHNRGKFNPDSICGCQVINLQMFSWDQESGF